MKIGFDVQHWTHVYVKHFVIDTDNSASQQINAQDATKLGACEICGRVDGSHHSDCKH